MPRWRRCATSAKVRAVSRDQQRHDRVLAGQSSNELDQPCLEARRHLAQMRKGEHTPPDCPRCRSPCGRRQMQSLKAMERQVEEAPDKQVSLTDPDARSMATSGKGTGIVGYNVQIAVDAEHHLIVAHEVTKVGTDRSQLATMGGKARDATGCEEVTVLADRGYYNGEEVLACEGTGVLPVFLRPRPQATPNAVSSPCRISSTTPKTTATPARRASF